MTMPMPGDALEAARVMAHLGRLSDQRRRSRPLTDEEQEQLEDVDSCIHCGGHHSRACPRVKRIEFHPNGVIAAVEFWRDDEVNWDGVVFTDQGDETDLLSPDVVDDLNILVKATHTSGVKERRAAGARVELWLASLAEDRVQSDGALASPDQ